jgi:pimeloyl-ACP methyl ester carboxylesterase
MIPKTVLVIVMALLMTAYNESGHAELALFAHTNSCYLKNLRSQARCGELAVPLNYADKTGAGPEITLKYAIVPALKNDEASTPLFFLAGGPGQSAVELAGMIRGALHEVAQNHDLVFVDQRGTGKSNPLQCDTPELDPFRTISDEANTTLVRQCLENLEADLIAQGLSLANLSEFTTENSVHDLNRVRELLGYQQINLFGGSYGTRLGLTFMRMYPQTLRSVVLDSVAPPQLPIGLVGQHSARAFEHLLVECEQDNACSQAYGELRNTFVQLAAGLKRQSLQVDIRHPTDGTTTPFDISFESLVNSLRAMLYSPVYRRMIPLIISETAKGNYYPLVGVTAQNIEASKQIYMGLTLNVVCNEDFPRIAAKDFDSDADNPFGADASHKLWRLVCPLWPKYPVSPEFSEPVVSGLPVLLISGSMDPVTPPENAQAALDYLSNARHVVLPGGAHTPTFHSCARDLVKAFIDDLDLDVLDVSCIDDTPGTRFMLSLNRAG